MPPRSPSSSKAAQAIPNEQAEHNPATAHMFIVNPLSGGQRMDNLFSTHPATENRIAALEQLAAEMGRGGNMRSQLSACGDRSARAVGRQRRGPWG